MVLEAVVLKSAVEVAVVRVVAPLKVLVLLKVLAVVVLKADEKTPVALLYDSGKTAERDDEEILLLKRFQSELESLPLALVEANGRLKVITFDAAVIEKSVPLVEVASVCVPPLCV